MTIIDAHSHLWLHQDAVVDGQPIRTLPNGRALFFGEERQMLPPFMIDGRNSAEVFLYALGLGGRWINRAEGMLEDELGKALLKEAGYEF